MDVKDSKVLLKNYHSTLKKIARRLESQANMGRSDAEAIVAKFKAESNKGFAVWNELEVARPPLDEHALSKQMRNESLSHFVRLREVERV